MHIIGIVVDNDQLPIFQEALTRAGYFWKQEDDLPDETTMLIVHCEEAAIPRLEAVVLAAMEKTACEFGYGPSPVANNHIKKEMN